MSLREKLHSHVEGDIHFDEACRRIYSVDASILEVYPRCVVAPKTAEALQAAVQIAAEEGISVTARGAATGITGGCLGEGMILDTSRYLSRILEIDWEAETCLVEPGVVQDTLNKALSAKGYRLGPNTSTGNRSTVGGMFATNAAGSHSLYYGQMVDHVLGTKLILADGSVQTFSPLTLEAWRKSPSLLGKLYTLREKHRETIRSEFPKIKRRASGYNLEALLAEDLFNPCKLLVGSEGTLGIASSIKLKIVRPLKKRVLTLLFFSDMLAALSAVPELLRLSPYALEMIDADIIEGGKKSPTMQGRLSWLEGSPACVLAIELPEERILPKFPCCTAVSTLTETAAEDFWAVRKAGLELLLSKRHWQRAIAFIEDLAVPPETLPSFMSELLKLLNAYGKKAGIYGHVGESCLHIRPYIDLSDGKERGAMIELMQQCCGLVRKYGGVLSGEHGDGLIRSWQNRFLFGEKINRIFEEVKDIFDPKGVMNPGKIVHPMPLEGHLRMTTRPQEVETFQDFSNEGGFALAVDLCNGNGLCRKKDGVMCPSFQATENELDSTRARAQLLRSVVHGTLSGASLSHPALQEVLDLCLACKGCKRECPSQVDMAKMKQETLHHYHALHGVPLRTRLLAHLADYSRIASKAPGLASFFSNLFRRFIGIAPERKLPKPAQKRFSKQFSTKAGSKDVVLYNDTYAEFYEPEIGVKAVAVLNALGYRVQMPEWSCCGRPLLTKGLLEEGQQALQAVLDRLYPYAKEGKRIIGLEPSCILTLKDDARSLRLDPHMCETVVKQCVTLDEFLWEHRKEFPFHDKEVRIALHGHCHQKALVGMEKTLEFLRAHPKSHVELVPSGCCGMAGAFGYEKEHYPLSVKIANLQLIPYLMGCPEETLIVASGFSCRTQIADLTQKRALHLAEAAYSLLK